MLCASWIPSFDYFPILHFSCSQLYFFDSYVIVLVKNNWKSRDRLGLASSLKAVARSLLPLPLCAAGLWYSLEAFRQDEKYSQRRLDRARIVPDQHAHQSGFVFDQRSPAVPCLAND